MVAFDHAIALYEVHALEGDVKASIVGVFEQHEFAAPAVGDDLAQAFELADTVIDMDDEVAGFEIGEVAEEARSANFAAGAIYGGGNVEEIGLAVKGDLRVGKGYALGKGRANEQQFGEFVGSFGGEARGGVFGFAQHVGGLVFAANISEALEFTSAGGGE